MPKIFGGNEPQASVPSNIERNIFYLFDRKTLNKARLVNKDWKKIADARDSTEVVIYFWLPSQENLGKSGHVSLETFSGNMIKDRKGIYASFWPNEEVGFGNLLKSFSSKLMPSLAKDIEQQNDQPPDHSITLTLDAKKINAAFVKFLNKKMSDCPVELAECRCNWFVFASNMFNAKDSNLHNCVSLVFSLLEATDFLKQKMWMALIKQGAISSIPWGIGMGGVFAIPAGVSVLGIVTRIASFFSVKPHSLSGIAIHNVASKYIFSNFSRFLFNVGTKISTSGLIASTGICVVLSGLIIFAGAGIAKNTMLVKPEEILKLLKVAEASESEIDEKKLHSLKIN